MKSLFIYTHTYKATSYCCHVSRSLTHLKAADYLVRVQDEVARVYQSQSRCKRQEKEREEPVSRYKGDTADPSTNIILHINTVCYILCCLAAPYCDVHVNSASSTLFETLGPAPAPGPILYLASRVRMRSNACVRVRISRATETESWMRATRCRFLCSGSSSSSWTRTPFFENTSIPSCSYQ